MCDGLSTVWTYTPWRRAGAGPEPPVPPRGGCTGVQGVCVVCAECVRQTGASVRVLDHTCGECRRGGITSRAAAVRLAPRTIATLFMAKRRFNKYAHRQYLQSRRRRAEDASDCDLVDDDLM